MLKSSKSIVSTKTNTVNVIKFKTEYLKIELTF